MSDERADFEALFLHTRAPLLAYLSRRARPEDAADLLAEVYFVAWRKRAELPSGDARRLWLYGVARRLLAEQRRLSLGRVDAEDGALEARTSGPRNADDQRVEALRRALDSLGEVDRELVTLTTWEGLSPTDAARVVGIAAGTARVRLHRARARLARDPDLRALFDVTDEPFRTTSSARRPARSTTPTAAGSQVG